MLELKVNGTSYKGILENVEWSGTLETSSRSVFIRHLRNCNVTVGDKIELLNSGTKLFSGMAYEVDSDSTKVITSFTAFDNGIRLNKNVFVKNYFNKKPSEVTREICGEIGIKCGGLPKDYGLGFTFPAIGKTGYNIILTAYTLQHQKDKKIYSVVVNDEAIEVIEQGTLIDVTLSSASNLENTSYSESITNMVNQLIIYETDKDNIQIKDKIQNIKDINKYGVFQDVLQTTNDTLALINPQTMLTKLERKARVTVLGDYRLKSGYSVIVESPDPNVSGMFLIVADKHIVTGGMHTTELTLSFENIMNTIDVAKLKKAQGIKNVEFEIEKYLKEKGKLGG